MPDEREDHDTDPVRSYVGEPPRPPAGRRRVRALAAEDGVPGPERLDERDRRVRRRKAPGPGTVPEEDAGPRLESLRGEAHGEARGEEHGDEGGGESDVPPVPPTDPVPAPGRGEG